MLWVAIWSVALRGQGFGVPYPQLAVRVAREAIHPPAALPARESSLWLRGWCCNMQRLVLRVSVAIWSLALRGQGFGVPHPHLAIRVLPEALHPPVALPEREFEQSNLTEFERSNMRQFEHQCLQGRFRGACGEDASVARASLLCARHSCPRRAPD